MDLPEHHLADKGYRYVHPADILGTVVANADTDGVYLMKEDGRKFLVALNGQYPALIEYTDAG